MLILLYFLQMQPYFYSLRSAQIAVVKIKKGNASPGHLDTLTYMRTSNLRGKDLRGLTMTM